MSLDVFLITSTFPFSPGEEFLETEVLYWANYKEVNLHLLPTKQGATLRNIPKNVTLDKSLCSDKKNKFKYALQALFNKMFLKEFFTDIYKEPKRLKYALSSFMQYLFLKEKLDLYLQKNQDKEILFYTYWYTEANYALQTLKKKYDFKLISRAHRFDLYKEARPYAYMPLKKQFVNKIDTLFTITPKANDYLIQNYSIDENIIKNSNLGVQDQGINCLSSEEGTFHIVSCSYISPVKQLETLVQALKILALDMKDINIKWTHIGGGHLEKTIQAYAHEVLGNISHLSYVFMGEMSNQEVLKFYKDMNIDVFINVSASEGVPVSIMEAMHSHIPIIAPNIGGISEMIENDYNGVLLPAQPSLKEISNALAQVDYFKASLTKENAYLRYKEKYDANVNYTQFIENVLSMKKKV